MLLSALWSVHTEQLWKVDATDLFFETTKFYISEDRGWIFDGLSDVCIWNDDKIITFDWHQLLLLIVRCDWIISSLKESLTNMGLLIFPLALFGLYRLNSKHSFALNFRKHPHAAFASPCDSVGSPDLFSISLFSLLENSGLSIQRWLRFVLVSLIGLHWWVVRQVWRL